MTARQPAPTVSVIIAAYNTEDTLGAQLQALSRERSAQPFEVLVCDNGSTDDTAALAQQLTGSLLNLRLIDASARRGPGAARNIGASAARGQLLLFCDADDVIEPGWVDALCEAAQHADLVAGALEGRSLNRHHSAAVSWEVSSEITMAFWPRYPAGASSNMAVRASAFRAVGGFDESLRTGEDIDLCWRIQIAGYSFARSREAVVHSRQREGRRAIFRQAYAYSAGHRALQFKYRRLIAADAADPGRSSTGPVATGPEPTEPAPAHSMATDNAAPAGVGDPAAHRSLPGHRGLAARARRALLTPTGQANVAWRLGQWLGARFGPIPEGIRPLEDR